MAESHKSTWPSTALLLCSLMAGIITTRFVPAYHEHEGKVTYPTRAAAQAEAPSESKPGYTNTQASANDPQITLVRHVQ